MFINGYIAKVVAAGDAGTPATNGGVRQATGTATDASTSRDSALLQRLLVHLFDQDVDIV